MANHQAPLQALVQNMKRIIIGKDKAIELAIVTLLSRGHLLLEDVPGLGKTIFARALARSIEVDFKRVQFTPDLLPSDLTGVSIYNQKTAEFEFRPGPVFTHVLLADEINRATPRTQSSLLECMAEFQVTADGKTYALPGIFIVLATQNPIELQGTYPLPEAQLDRFFMRVTLGYPSVEEEVRIMQAQVREHPIERLSSVLAENEVIKLQTAVKDIHVGAPVQRYIAELIAATRAHPDIQVGASPRGSLALMRGAQAIALMRGVDFTDPAMVKTLAQPVLAHRLIVKPHAQLAGKTANAILDEILRQVEPPVTTTN